LQAVVFDIKQLNRLIEPLSLGKLRSLLLKTTDKAAFSSQATDFCFTMPEDA
jgi:hypothetical protein